ncbi:MAG TPA: dihydropteroate synthase [Actinomycetota bacterium]|nr:dihydropteroate synthase [Actinomycetota bacterium]
MAIWECCDRHLSLDRVLVMGILNVTPDSFSDGGLFLDPFAAADHAARMLEEGADIIDVGGESTRPGADEVSIEDELSRVIPVVEAIVSRTGATVSIDTTKSRVARAAVDVGAVIVNDVTAMRSDPSMPDVITDTGAGIVLMHMLGNPRTMQADPTYGNVVADVKAALIGWAGDALAAGVPDSAIVLDPGIGFGKTREHNLQLLKGIPSLCEPGFPILIGTSRKSFIGTTLDVPVGERLEGTAATVAWAVAHGAKVVRVHDVKEMVRVVRMTEAIARSV